MPLFGSEISKFAQDFARGKWQLKKIDQFMPHSDFNVALFVSADKEREIILLYSEVLLARQEASAAFLYAGCEDIPKKECERASAELAKIANKILSMGLEDNCKELTLRSVQVDESGNRSVTFAVVDFKGTEREVTKTETETLRDLIRSQKFGIDNKELHKANQELQKLPPKGPARTTFARTMAELIAIL